MKIAYLGPEGTFSHEAAERYQAEQKLPDLEMVPCTDMEEIVQRVVNGATLLGILPVHNSLAGIVQPAQDAMDGQPIVLLGELKLPVSHCLLGLSGAQIGALVTVLSHAKALEQCRHFLAEHPGIVEHRKCSSTAEAARQIAEKKDPTWAAIASKKAAELYGLEVLASDIQDSNDNTTTFVIFSAEIALLRNKIEKIDRDLIKSLDDRMEIAGIIGQIKGIQGLPVRDPEREKQLQEQHEKWAQDCHLDPKFVLDLFQQIIAESRRRQSERKS